MVVLQVLLPAAAVYDEVDIEVWDTDGIRVIGTCTFAIKRLLEGEVASMEMTMDVELPGHGPPVGRVTVVSEAEPI